MDISGINSLVGSLQLIKGDLSIFAGNFLEQFHSSFERLTSDALFLGTCLSLFQADFFITVLVASFDDFLGTWGILLGLLQSSLELIDVDLTIISSMSGHEVANVFASRVLDAILLGTSFTFSFSEETILVVVADIKGFLDSEGGVLLKLDSRLRLLISFVSLSEGGLQFFLGKFLISSSLLEECEGVPEILAFETMLFSTSPSLFFGYDLVVVGVASVEGFDGFLDNFLGELFSFSLEADGGSNSESSEEFHCFVVRFLIF